MRVRVGHAENHDPPTVVKPPSALVVMAPGLDRPGLNGTMPSGLYAPHYHRPALRPGPRPIQAGDPAPRGPTDATFPDRWVGSGH